MVTMFGWFSRASSRASRVNRSANAGSAASDCGRIFSATQPVELRLPGLEDHAHAALADEFEDFELRKSRGDLLQRRGRGPRREMFRRRRRPGEQTARAEPLRGTVCERRTAFGTMILGHGRIHTPPS